MRRLTWMSRGRANARALVIPFIVAALCGESLVTRSGADTRGAKTLVTVNQSSVIDIALKSQRSCPSNCYLSQQIIGTFTPPHGSRATVVIQHGFIEKSGSSPGQTWHVRFTPTVTGLWTYSISPRSPDPGLTTVGHLLATSPQSSSHGFLRIDSTHPRSFAFDEGSHFFMLGNTEYELALVSLFEGRSALDANLNGNREAGINTLRVLVYPWDDGKGTKGDPHPAGAAPFSDPGTNQVLNGSYFDALDRVVHDAQTMHMQIDLEMFDDNWDAFSCEKGAECADPPKYEPGTSVPNTTTTCEAEQCSGWPSPAQALEDMRYVDYVVARYSAYTNVQWTLTNEFQYTPYPDFNAAGVLAHPSFWDTVGRRVTAEDPYMTSTLNPTELRPISIHSSSSYPVNNAGAQLLFSPVTSFPWETSTAFQSSCVGNGPSSTPDQEASAPQRRAANQSAALPLVTAESNYWRTNPRVSRSLSCGRHIGRLQDRQEMWATIASGGYFTLGDANAVPPWSWDRSAPTTEAAIAGDFVPDIGTKTNDVYLDTSHVAQFWSKTRMPYWAMSFDPKTSNAAHRLYGESLSDSDYLVYSAVRQPISIQLAAGAGYKVEAFDPATGLYAEPVGMSHPIPGSRSPITVKEPSTFSGDWVCYATRV